MNGITHDPQVWFITGASSGLGLSVLKHVLSKGDKAVATLRKPEVLTDLAAKYSALQLLIVKLDVKKEDEIVSAFKAAEERFGRIDVVYNNAGYGTLVEIEGTPDHVSRDMFEVNFWGAANVSREAVRFFRDVNKPAGGRLLQASSLGGASASPALGYYCASKFALEGFSEALASELLPSWNIKISIIQIGAFRTRAVVEIPTFPLHPLYNGSNSIQMREYFSGPMEGMADAADGAREIYNIAGDKQAPLFVPLGFDAIAKADTKIKLLKEGVAKSEKWAVSLK
ncbi:hypothetical protein BDQ17DRAFT_1363847 [Cyathus striatus]|nr:hypothetical protein BDQ17DRAFT_1363847 [Cyathus striatus]